jgi:putative nucleotidyltransferase with HDIG domain
MNSTRVARAEFKIVDDVATEQARNSARLLAPRVCVLIASAIEEVRASLDNLPVVMQSATSPDDVDPEVRKQFGLTPAAVMALHIQMTEGKVRPEWSQQVQRLQMELLRTPMLTEEDFREVTQSGRMIELRLDPVTARLIAEGVEEAGSGQAAQDSGVRSLLVPTSAAVSLSNQHLAPDLRKLARSAGFEGVLADVVTARLTSPVRATYSFDSAATAARLDEAARLVQPKIVAFPVGEVVYKRGERLKGTDLTKVQALARAERKSLEWWQRWSGRLALLGLTAAIAGAIAGYTALFVPRIRRNPARILGVAGLLALASIIGCWATVAQPGLIALTGVAPTVFATVILAVAYHQRVALAYGSLHGILMCFALDQPIGLYAIMVAGIGVAVWQLKEVRDRDALIRMGIFEAIALAVGTFMVNLVELPLTRQALQQAGWDAGLAGFGGLLVSGVTLYLLPTLERRFGLLTGMTLIELRDPKQALLRQLQQRAPGTYNHSLTIASLGEAAAEAIGADGLLTYVGALYHDIGKMNKPDYFVENQVPGFNRHDKLSPAMSLLVIVGHVKDGLELAREFNLPKPLHHFIESHHGTTLVEYFFHRAKKQAEAAVGRGGGGGGGAGGGGDDSEEAEVPAEIEYRYPGPRPRTKEAAILMVCDAVESASRTLGDPTPSRIDQLVRSIANKRLLDGQFDECDLTLRELNVIVETVSKTLASIYHGRIQYPTGTGDTQGGSGITMGPKTSTGIAPAGQGSSIITGSGVRERARIER